MRSKANMVEISHEVMLANGSFLECMPSPFPNLFFAFESLLYTIYDPQEKGAALAAPFLAILREVES
jgi:hypothetical protein